MSDPQEPVDTGSLQADIAAINAAPVETNEAEAPQAEAEDVVDEQNEPEAEAASDGNDPPAKPKPKGVGKRIDELTRDKYDAIRERDYWREQAQRLAQPQQAPQAQAVPEGKPTLEAFGYDHEAYTEALTDWKVQEHLRTLQAHHQQVQQQQKVVETLTKFQERVASVDPEEWQWAVEANPPTSPAMLEVIAESEVGPQIGIYLAKHPDESAAIARMSPIAAARHLGRIEAQLSAPVAPPSVPPKTVTKAPAPVSTLRPAAPIRKELSEMSQAEYEAERTRQRKAAGLIK